MNAALHRSRFLPLIAALAGAAWVALWLWGQSPYAQYLDHGNWSEIGIASTLCHALPGSDAVLAGLLVVSGWVLMLTAMMLPTTLPLLEIFGRLTALRADRRSLLALVIIGYLAVWGIFGLAAHLAIWGVLSVARQWDWLTAHGWLLGAVTLAAAGLYQFSKLNTAVSTSAGRRSALSSNGGAVPRRNGTPLRWGLATAPSASAAVGH